MISYTPSSPTNAVKPDAVLTPPLVADELLAAVPVRRIGSRQAWLIFAAAIFLVSVPVFIQAPLVRLVPGWSLVLTFGWIWLSLALLSRPTTKLWGDLLLGFSWTWLAGSIYWGWLRWEPLLHLPVEAIAVPFVIGCLLKNWGKTGSFFYLGSLFGTAVTDLYFYAVDLIPHWRRLMQVEPDQVMGIFQTAVLQVKSPAGICWAIALSILLLVVGTLPLGRPQIHWWAFSGAVLSTILVDSLFWLAASTA